MLSQHYPVRQICRALRCPRSSHYYPARRRDETSLRAAIERLAGAWPTYGYRRITALLRREHVQVNRKHVARLMREMGLQGRRPTRPPRTTHSDHVYRRSPNLVQGLTIVRPDHVWVGDLTYIQLREECVSLAVLMDVYTRSIRGWHLSRPLDQALTLTALRRALVQRRPDMHHSDQGVQYAATAYVQTLQALGVQISMATAGEATENGYAECLMRTIKEAEVALHNYADFHEAYHSIGHFLNAVYQHKRIHSALGYLTPAEFETAWQQDPMAASVKLAPPYIGPNSRGHYRCFWRGQAEA
jgi:putative transposase